MIDEGRRVEALRAYRILDTDREPVFDDVVDRACALFGAPIAMIAFIDAKRLWVKAGRGMSLADLARGASICEHVLEQPGPLLVPDLSADSRFAENPLVAGPLAARFYAGVPIISAEGHYVGVVCVMDVVARDSTDVAAVIGLGALARLCRNELEHRREIRAVTASEARLRDLVGLATDWAWETDAQHRLVRIEVLAPAVPFDFQYISGVTRWQIAGGDIAKEPWRSHLAQLSAREAFRDFEHESVRPDGTRMRVRSSGRPIFQDGVFRGYRGVTTDITAQRLAQRQMQDRNAEFAALFRRHPQPMWLHEPGSLRFLDVNDSMCSLFGYAREEFAGLTTLDLVPAADREAVGQMSAGMPADASYQVERRHQTRDGHAIDAVVSVAPAQFDGQPACFTMLRDVTQQRVAEGHAAESERMLRQNQQIEALAKLAGGMAHEFNNLLTVIISATEMLSEGLPADDQGRQLAGMALEAAQRGAQLADSLMTISRQQDMAVLRIDVGAVLRGMAGSLRSLLEGEVALEIAVGEGSLLSEIDEGQLTIAITNLVVNARDALHGNGVIRIGVDARDIAPVDALADARLQPGSWVAVTVSDNGWGMAPAVADKAFEPYFTTKPVGQGTGLGLSMVHGFVHQSGGFAVIDSRIGAGTTVRLFFPAVRTRRDFASA